MTENSSDLYRDWAEAQNLLQKHTGWGRTDDIPFYVQQANEQGGKILEIGCGTGRIHLELLQQHDDVYGLDSSKTQLDILEDRAESMGLEPKTYQMDMREFELDPDFDLIIIPFNGFSHMTTRQDQLQVLETMRRHLSDNGKVVLDIPFPRMGEGTYTRRFTVDGDEYFLVESYDLDIVERVKHIERQLFKNGSRFGSTSYEYARIFRNEFIHMIQRAGYEDWDLYGDFDRSVLDEESHSLIWEIRTN